MKQLTLTSLALLAALPLGAKTLYFSPKVNVNGQWTWASKENWSTDPTDASKTASVAEGDDLVIDRAANNFHAANCGNYVNSIRFTKNSLPYSGVSWNGFYLKEGGEGLIVEHTGDKSCYSTLYLDGEVKVNLTGGEWWEGGVVGRDATRKSRIVKLGAAQLTLAKVNGNWTGATITEGTLKLDADSGQSGIAFHFDGSADTAKFTLGSSITLKDGGLTSTADLPITDHGVYDGGAKRTLTISGAPTTNDMYYAGGFHQTTSFAFVPSAPGSAFTAARATSTTSGDLTVSNATFRVADGAAFPSLTRLTVRKDGVLSIAADAGDVNPQYLELDGGKIQVDADKTLEVLTVYTNLVPVAMGAYTAATADWVTGEGTVRVNPRKGSVDEIDLDVGEGQTVTLADALAAYNGTHAGEAGFADVTVDSLNGGKDKGRTLVKKGLGLLRMNTPIASYAGAVHVEAGVLKTEVRYSIGKESNAAAPVYVYDGATFWTLTTNTAMNVGRTFHIAGKGFSNYGGALYCESCQVKDCYHLANLFGSRLFLDADAAVHIGPWDRLTDSLYLNRHTLTVNGNNGNSNDSPFHIATVEDDGHIVVSRGEWRFETTTFNGTTPGNTVTFLTRAGWRYTNNDGTVGNIGNWSFIVKGPDSAIYSDYHIQSREASNINRHKVATTLDTLAEVRYQGDRVRGSLSVPVAVKGTGGFKTTEGRTVFLHLLNPANSFTGGLWFERGVIWAYDNGTVPNGDGAGAVTLTPNNKPYNKAGTFVNYFDGIAFMSPDAYALPALRVVGAVPARVQNGAGAWKEITVNGAGGVDYYSELGAPTLDIRKGTFRLPVAAGAGLWEGTANYADEAAAQAAYAGDAAFTNLAVRGPTMVVREEAYNYTLGSALQLVTYTGYVWNRADADVTWTFASSVNRPVTIKIDGNAVLTADASTLKGANVTLTPGPHRFEYRAYANATAVAPYAPTGWRADFGFAYDTRGRNDTSTTNNFVACVDTGDGALFTRYADPEAHQPKFDAIRVGTGGAFDLNGTRYTAEAIGGAGVVTNSAATEATLVVKAVTVDASADETLTAVVPVELAEGFTVKVANAAQRIRKGHVALKTKARMTGAPAAITAVADDGTLWNASLSSDGTTLTVAKAGLLILLK